MTFAWYGHLKHLQASPWWIAALVSWGIALFEYLLQVPANRIGFAGGITLAQLKILQEVITLAVFVPFAMFYMGEGLKLDYLWAGLCLVGAVYFIFPGLDARDAACTSTSSASAAPSWAASPRSRASAATTVTGCDAQVYPPMSDQLRSLGIDAARGLRRRAARRAIPPTSTWSATR